MMLWLAIAGYEGVWFAAVIGAGHGWWWTGVAATALFAAWRLGVSTQRHLELHLIALALAVGVVMDALGPALGLMDYAAAWPWPAAPAWLTALWLAFALTIVPLFRGLRERLWWAAVLGAVGGPMAYLGAAHGWQAVRFAAPAWGGLLLLAAGWAITLPMLCAVARRGWRASAPLHAASAGSAP